jgi:predicted permease
MTLLNAAAGPLVLLGSELRWAWRSVRSRRIASLIHILLVALGVGAGGVLFSAADAFVFNPAPYPNADRLVVFQRESPVGVVASLSAEEQRDLSIRKDLFTAWYVHSMGAPTQIAGRTALLRTQNVQPGLFEALGVLPQWGRPLASGDEQPGRETVVLIGADLARTLFGEPGAAVGRTFETSTGTMRVVGVMPDGFRFPTALEKIWQAALKTSFPPNIAAVAPGVSLIAIEHAVSAYANRLVETPGRPAGPLRAVPLSRAEQDPRSFTNSGAFNASSGPRLFSMLLGVALCLAVIICLNVASLELASALERTRVLVVQTALGATRGTLIRSTLFETVMLTAGGAALGLVLAIWGTSALMAALPAALDAALTNPIDVDLRTAAFTAGLALMTGILTSTPVVWYASRADFADGLRRGAHTLTATRAQKSFRHLLITCQVALSVALLVIAALFAQSYGSRLAAKGFESGNLATFDISGLRGTPERAADLDRAIQRQLDAHPGVRALSRTSLLLPGGLRGGMARHIWLQGATSSAGLVGQASFGVDPDYFETVGVRLLAGRQPGLDDSADQVVVDEALARRFWPDGNAVGARFSLGTEKAPGETFEIVGVVSHVELEAAEFPRGGPIYAVYRTLDGFQLGRTGAPSYAPIWIMLKYVVRLTRPEMLGEVTSLVQSTAQGATVSAGLMDDHYTEVFGDTRIAAGLTSSFGVVALVVALLGLYGVAAFFVAGRTREIGIRLALGARPRNVHGLVLRSAIQPVMLGAFAGSALALIASRWIGNQLFGVAPTDPTTYVLVVSTMLVTVLVATWRPARRASNTSLAAALRAE